MFARQVRVAGRVQGVAFRAWTKEAAEEIGVRGWVRNRCDGSVEAHLEGDGDNVADLIERMRHGPALARVDELISEPAASKNFDGFHLWD